MRQNVYSSGVFTEGRPFCTQILHGKGRPTATTLGIRKLETLGYPMVKTHPQQIEEVKFSSFWHYTGVWRTDTQTDTERSKTMSTTVNSFFKNKVINKYYCTETSTPLGSVCCGFFARQWLAEMDVCSVSSFAVSSQLSVWICKLLLFFRTRRLAH